MVLSTRQQSQVDSWVKPTWDNFTTTMENPQLVNKALGRSQTEDDSTLLRWLMEALV